MNRKVGLALVTGLMIGYLATSWPAFAVNYLMHSTDTQSMVVVDVSTGVNVFTSDAAYDPASLAAGAARNDNVTVTGIVANKPVVCNPRVQTAQCKYNCRATATNTVEIQWYNGDDGVGGAACDTDSSTWDFMQPIS